MSHHRHESANSPRRVLVVDDDDAMRTVAAEALRAEGYVVREASDALAAMRAVLAEPLDVVVLNLLLADGRGIEVAGAFRAVTTTRDICVVAMTAQPESMRLVDARSLGAAKILVKPVDAAALLDAVAGCFSKSSWTGELERPIGRPIG